MKTKTTLISSLFTGLFFAFQVLLGQATYSVNPNPLADPDFLSLQTAIDSVPAGSVLLVHGGVYGSNILIDKQLTIIGPGYFLNENPETQATPMPAEMNGMNLQPGAAGSYISGLSFSGNQDFEIYASGVIFQRNNFGFLDINIRDANSIIFKQNIGHKVRAISGSITNCLFENNIFSHVIKGTGSLSFQGVLRNNIFTGEIYSNSSYYLSNSVYQNNICTKNINSGTYRHPIQNSNGNLVENNLFVGSTYQNLNNVNGNVENVSLSALFVGPTNNSSDGQYKLSANSPAIGAGVGGVDCGIFGGPDPYVLSGIPFVPNIYELTVPFTGTSGGGIDVQIKVKANQ